jgi:hypothetical protein
MARVERIIFITYNGLTYTASGNFISDDNAIHFAIHEVERKLKLMRGALTKYFKNNPDNIVVKLK